MPNHFAILEMPERPWLDADALKSAFHRLGARHHPDTPGGDAAISAAVNAAWQVLRDPAQRLRHLLDLAGVAPLAGSAEIPAALADTFMLLATLRRTLDDFSKREAATTGTLARALLAGERAALQRDLQRALTHLEAQCATTDAELRALDASWPTPDPRLFDRLATLQQALAFTGKWSDQLREALFRLGA